MATEKVHMSFFVKLRSEDGHQAVLGKAFPWAYGLRCSLTDTDQILDGVF